MNVGFECVGIRNTVEMIESVVGARDVFYVSVEWDVFVWHCRGEGRLWRWIEDVFYECVMFSRCGKDAKMKCDR